MSDLPDPTILMICGSRFPTPQAIEYTRNCVRNAYRRGWYIVVGDSIGVDAEVARSAAALFDLHPDPQADDAPDKHNLWRLCRIYGLGITARHWIMQGPGLQYNQLAQIPRRHVHQGERDIFFWNWTEEVTTYSQRDEYLVQLAHQVMCIWNEDSPATARVYELAEYMNKEAHLVKI